MIYFFNRFYQIQESDFLIFNGSSTTLLSQCFIFFDTRKSFYAKASVSNSARLCKFGSRFLFTKSNLHLHLLHLLSLLLLCLNCFNKFLFVLNCRRFKKLIIGYWHADFFKL